MDAKSAEKETKKNECKLTIRNTETDLTNTEKQYMDTKNTEWHFNEYDIAILWSVVIVFDEKLLSFRYCFFPEDRENLNSSVYSARFIFVSAFPVRYFSH